MQVKTFIYGGKIIQASSVIEMITLAELFE